MKVFRLLLAVLVGCITGISTGAMANASAGSASYVCSGGNIPSGTYSSVLVTGVCYVPAGLVQVTGDLTVAPGALLDATTPPGGLGAPTANLPGIVQVGGNVHVENGAVLFFGCDAAIGCPFGSSTYPGPPGLLPPLGFSNPGDMVAGNLDGNGALGVVVHSVKIGGNASLINGGGGPAQLTGGPGSGACFDPSVVPVPSPWSADPTLFGVPVYSDFEDNSIGGDLKLIGLQTCWTGALRNAVAGNILDLNNTWGDPDANEVVTNTVGGSMVCLNNNHVVQFGDSIGVPIPQTPNIVSGNAVGECGFGVIDPEAGGLHISVKA